MNLTKELQIEEVTDNKDTISNMKHETSLTIGNQSFSFETGVWAPQTNGLSRTAVAIRLVSMQRADGRWMEGTNDVTSAALRMLRELSR